MYWKIVQYNKKSGGICMKKLLSVFALASLMVLTFSCSVLGASQVYFDYIIDGEWDSVDLSGFAFGLDYKNDSTKFGFDYLTGDINNGVSDYNQFILKGGYGINENVFITISMIDNTAENNFAEISANGILLGIDVSYNFSEQVSFEGSFGFSLSGEGEAYVVGYGSSSGDVDFSILKFKITNNISDSIGISFGYNDISCELEDSDSIDVTYMTLGMVVKF
jgi:hypothetical protein